jgi:hypothetical protein
VNPALWPPIALLALSQPTPLPPGAAEALARGEVVVHALPAREPGRVRFDAWVEVPADAAATWTALVDLAARDRASRSIVAADVYHAETLADGGSRRCVRWEASRLGVGIVYHHCFVANREHTRLAHTLDVDRSNDLQVADGLFELSAAGAPGRTRVRYTAETALAEGMPDFLVSWISGGNARDVLADLSVRASGAAR